nr:response regulator [uncultured Duganella sp.]
MGSECRRILIIDDNRDAAETLSWLFELNGHAVLTAHGGAEGLRAVEAFSPDVVFLDLGMPGMTGYQVAEELRRMPLAHQPLLIAFTAWDDARSRRRVAESGFDLHVAKTSSVDILLAAAQSERGDSAAKLGAGF